ncbi:MAG TPA: hypothetical protein VMG98_09180 [Verrucomicrobiae bacterium]|nr:hypothetical protein [Verrucomicrobiae bacterium]
MIWDELLDEYRALGGIAENVRLDSGPFGRGIFPIEPGKPMTLRTPPALHVPVSDIRVRDGRMTAGATRIDARALAFFEAYEAYFGWGAGGLEATWELQDAWHTLPDEVAGYIRAMGTLDDPDRRFAAPSVEVCMHDFLSERKFGEGSHVSIVPLIDLVNHSSYVPTYTLEGGLGVRGTFDGEVFVRYNRSDPWGLMTQYGFAATSPVAYSVSITVGLPRSNKLVIARDIDSVSTVGALQFPTLETTGDTITLSHLPLGFETAKDLPRAMFRKMLDSRVTAVEADYIFDGIQHYNRTLFLKLLLILRKYDAPLVRTLEEAAIDQLESLSACVGARPL